jgi:hypothetical protein
LIAASALLTQSQVQLITLAQPVDLKPFQRTAAAKIEEVVRNASYLLREIFESEWKESLPSLESRLVVLPGRFAAKIESARSVDQCITVGFDEYCQWRIDHYLEFSVIFSMLDESASERVKIIEESLRADGGKMRISLFDLKPAPESEVN